MLVLTRKEGQTVTIDVGGGITIVVLGIEPGVDGGVPRVRLAFSAEKEIRIVRGEAREKGTP